jgi:hypothetical protein
MPGEARTAPRLSPAQQPVDPPPVRLVLHVLQAGSDSSTTVTAGADLSSISTGRLLTKFAFW